MFTVDKNKNLIDSERKINEEASYVMTTIAMATGACVSKLKR